MKRSGQVLLLHEKVVKAEIKAWLHEQQIELFKEVGGLSVFSVQPSDSQIPSQVGPRKAALSATVLPCILQAIKSLSQVGTEKISLCSPKKQRQDAQI